MATSNAELQAEIDRILRMAVRLEPVDLRYDVNKDGRVSSADAYLVSSGAATIPPPPAPVVQQPWWVGQFASEADANFVDTNRNQQIEETERAAWRSQYDPNSTEYQQRVSQEQEAARQEAARVATAEQERLNQQQQLVQLASYIDPSSSGGAWGTASGKSSGPGFGSEGMIKQIAQRLQNVTGVSDINDLELRTVNKPRKVNIVTTRNGFYIPEANRYLSDEERGTVQTQENVFADGLTEYYYTAEINLPTQEIYNKKTGQMLAEQSSPSYDVYGNLQKNQELNIDLGGWGEGEGMTYANLTFNANGKPVIKTWGVDTSDAGTIFTILSIALMAVPGIGQAVGAALLPTGVSVTTATALGNLIIKTGFDVASGVPLDKAIKNNAASFGVSQFVPNLTGNVYVDNAVRSVATAALTDGDVGNALANSLIATGGNELLGNTSFTGDKVVDSAIASSITSGVQAAATDGDVGASIIRGGIAGASSELSKQTASSESAKSGAGFIGEDAVDSVAGAIGNDIVSAVGNDVLSETDGLLPGSLGTTPDVGMDTVGSAAQDDVLGVIAQEQADIRAQTASQAMQGAKQITAAEAAARELYPLTERYQGPNGTIYVRDINTGKITQLLPTGEASAITGGGVFLDRPDVIGAVEALPANAVYQGILYANDPKLIGKQLTADDLENLSLSTGRDANVLPVGNLVVRQNADGTVTQFDKVTGDTATIDASGKIVGQTKSLYTRLNDTANAVTGTGQSALGELGASLSATGQQLGLNTQGLIENFQAMQAAGERMRPESVNQQSTAFVDEIYQVASRPGVTATEIAKAVVNASKNNPIGAVAVLGSELIQELPTLLLPGGNVAKFLGSMALNVGESAGAQALQKIDELKVSNPTATPQELARLARQDSGIAALTTASLSLIPGANNALVRTLIEPFSEALEEGLIEYATSGNINAARGKAVLGAVIGGKTSAAINTGEQLASAAQTNLGVQLPSNTPTASITVTAPRDATGVVSSGGVDLDLNEDIVGELPPTDLTDLINIPINVGSTANNALTVSTGDDNVVAGDESNGVVLQNNNDGTSLVLTQGGGSTVVPSVDSFTGNQLQPGSTVVVNTANNTASTAPVTQPTGGAVVSQDAGQVVGTGSTLPSTSTGGASTGGTAVVTQAQDAALQAEINKIIRMAVGQETTDLRYDVNKDGRVNSRDAYLVNSGQATIPTAEQYAASQIALPQAGTGSTASGVVTGGQVDTGSTPGTGTVATESAGAGAGAGAGTGAGTSTGIVLQNNGNGTVLVLTSNGNASIVSDVDSNTGGTLTTGSSVVVNNNTGTASSTGAGTGTGTGPIDSTGPATDLGLQFADGDGYTGPAVSTGPVDSTGAATGVDTSGAVTAGTGVTTGDTTGATTGAVTGVTPGGQVDTGGTQLLPGTATVGGATSTDSTKTSTLTPGINVELPETIGGGTAVEDNVSGGGGNDLIVGGGGNDVIAGEPTGTTKTEEDLLLEQIIKELEPTPPVSEGVQIPEPVFPEPPLVLPESPTINVGDRLTIRPVVDRGYRRPSVSPGSRVEESAQILPLRPGLSEGGTGGIEGTTEQEQEPVWNVRSLKLRRLLGI